MSGERDKPIEEEKNSQNSPRAQTKLAKHVGNLPLLISIILSGFIALVLSFPLFFTTKPGELLAAKFVWIGFIGLASFRVFVTGRVSRWRSVFFMILAWAFILEFKSALVGLAGSAWITKDVQEVPYCHIAISSTLLNHLHGQYLAITSGNFLKWSPLTAGAFFWLLATLSIGQGWCSWACFYGGLDTTFTKLVKKPILKLYHLPRSLRDFSLALLIAVVLFSFARSEPSYCLWLCPLKITTGFLDPNTLIRRMQFSSFAILGILFIILIPLFIKKRAFCTFLCPFGAWQALVGRINPFKVTINADTCTLCQQCMKVCPVYAISPEGVEKHEVSSYCNRCGDCFDACPTGAIHYSFGSGHLSGSILPRVFFLISAWLVGGSVSLLFVPAALVRLTHWINLFFHG